MTKYVSISGRPDGGPHALFVRLLEINAEMRISYNPMPPFRLWRWKR